MKLVVLLATIATLNAAELRFPPMPNEPVKASLTNVQAAIRCLVVLDVAVTLQTFTNHSEPLAYNFRAIADVFRDMPTNGTFSVEHLQAQLAMVTFSEQLAPPRESLENVKAALVMVYARAYAHRGRAGVPPLEFLSQVSTTFSQAIREGIRQGGRPAVVE